MNRIDYLRECIRKCEDKYLSLEQLSREVDHVARDLRGDEDGPTRMFLVRSANKLRQLSEARLHDDVADEVRATIDELRDELINL